MGRILVAELAGFQIVTLGRANADIIADLSVGVVNLPKINTVIHAAGKAHIVPKTKKEKDEFFLVNVLGTKNLLTSLEPNLPESFLYISSVSVYGRTEGHLITEQEALNAQDPYGLSKIEAEVLIQTWCEKNNVKMCILRLPLLAGFDPPGNLGAMIKAISNGYYLEITGCIARKSVVMAKDVAHIIPKSIEIGGIYNLTDGYHPSVMELSNAISKQLGKNPPLSIPFWLARLLAKLGDMLGPKSPINLNKLKKITSNLTFDDSKARHVLGWEPSSVIASVIIKE